VTRDVTDLDVAALDRAVARVVTDVLDDASHEETYVVGSFARGQATDESDLDLVVTVTGADDRDAVAAAVEARVDEFRPPTVDEAEVFVAPPAGRDRSIRLALDAADPADVARAPRVAYSLTRRAGVSLADLDG
jgi:predicted nucleotidyltransferase